MLSLFLIGYLFSLILLLFLFSCLLLVVLLLEIENSFDLEMFYEEDLASIEGNFSSWFSS